ncbi:MAG TPA: hypothetical protein VLX92_20040 [Kofleriaceae bacterium]|nr:hypothetical protein [Kofleriaceae bacterium]
MSRSHLALTLLSVSLVACTGSSSGSGDDGPAPPFTNGVSTLAGAGDPGFVDGDRDVARFNNPTNVAVGPDGNVYVADWQNGKIRVVAPDGTTSTLVAQMGFARPFGLAFAGQTLYATTDSNGSGTHTPMTTGSVWQIDIHSGVATELANAIGLPRGIAALADGRLALGDYENHVVELLDPRTGAVTVLAGSFGVPGYADGVGGAARFTAPYGLVQRSDGKLVVVDQGNNRLRVVGLDGTVTTLAGTGQAGYADGAMTGGMFDEPQGIAIDGNDNLYITDLGNYRVRRIVGSTIDTIAGDGTAGYVDDDDRLSAELYGLEGLAVTKDGSMVYVADGTRGDDVPFNRVRQVKMQ